MSLRSNHIGNNHWQVFVLAFPMLCILVVPVLALIFSSSPQDLGIGLAHPLFTPALMLSLRTTVASLIIILLAGTPLAWWLANQKGRIGQAVGVLVELPIVLPPAVVGIALLQTFGHSGIFSESLEWFGIQIPFTTAAVVIAQVVVASPFYIQSATAAFRRVDTDLLLVARSLGQTRLGALRRVAIPVALPGLVTGGALAWARALGEFGATLLFAGNLTGTTQTMPLAIYTALESDVRVALALALVLGGAAMLLLFALRLIPIPWRARSQNEETSRPSFVEKS